MKSQTFEFRNECNGEFIRLRSLNERRDTKRKKMWCFPTMIMGWKLTNVYRNSSCALLKFSLINSGYKFYLQKEEINARDYK